MPATAKKKPISLTPKKVKVQRSRHAWVPAFVAALRNSGNVRASCAAAGVSRVTAYDHRDKDAAFAAQWKDALEDAIEALEASARQRAMNGSDVLTIFLLKAHRPDVYRERHEVRGDLNVSGALAVTYAPMRAES